ncbi:MAG: response regulator transcription factor [Oscillospiraceae bacterium]|nr:response regulator transcription factor [Oscillospiraceae bacterium]MDD7279978.1 response regulator transcription factor [Oscillospiraceae bacterium]MDY2863779.1 response regulator transcription factor [Oscillospiraceae bacterium]
MIYYAEDDSSIRELVLYTLKTTGFEARGFENGEKLFEALSAGDIPQLLLLDIMLPGEDGIEIMKRLRRGGYDFPVIMVTAKNSEYDKVTGLDCGADDYISKPFGMMELIARIKAVLRRAERTESLAGGDILSCGGVELDVRRHTVTVNGVPAELTLKEFELLRILMKNRNAVLTRDNLLESIWGYDCAGETRTVDVHIKTLRQKLGAGSEIIKTVRGVGYKICG